MDLHKAAGLVRRTVLGGFCHFDRRAYILNMERDVAVVLSGGGMNGMLMEVGFLKRLRETELWSRIRVFFGSSAGAFGSVMAALDRLDDLEEFLFGLQVHETFRPNRPWRFPLRGTHDYALPETIAERLGDPIELSSALAAVEPEVVVFATDVSQDGEPGSPDHPFELVYSSHTSSAEEFSRGLIASAAVSALVLPVAVGDRVATDGGWVRNFPVLAAYQREDVELIVAFRYEPRHPAFPTGSLAAAAGRLRRYSRLPAARAVVAELEEATQREERGEPVHVVDTLARLSRAAIGRNTAMEELTAQERERAVRELRALEGDVLGLIEAMAPGPDRDRLAADVEERFRAAAFPFAHDRLIPRITVRGSPGEVYLGAGWRRQQPWSREVKRALIERGHALADAEFRAAGVGGTVESFDVAS
jgi:predicted acylesterase/phospholipase RssA